MMPLVQAPHDIDFESRPESAMNISITGRERPRREILEDNRRLAGENARLSEENQDLREAATLWIRLYEKQLERANRATRATSANTRTEPSLK